MSNPPTLRGRILHQIYAEEWLRAAALIEVIRVSPVLSAPPSAVLTDIEWASENRMMRHGRPPVSECVTYDWSGSQWVPVVISDEVAAECIGRLSESRPVAYNWYRYALRSIAWVGPDEARKAAADSSLKGRHDEEPKRRTPEWSAERVSVVGDILGALRPYVSDRDSLLLRGSLLAGMSMGSSAYLFPTLDEAEMAEVSRRVP